MMASSKLGRWNRQMQRVDAGYLYDLGDAVRCIRAFRLREVAPYEIWQPLVDCRQKLTDFLHNSVYTGSIRGVVHTHAGTFIAAIDALIEHILTERPETVPPSRQLPMQDAYERFEPVFNAELSNQVMYLVRSMGVYDVIALVEQGSQLFPASVYLKAPEAVRDIQEGAKALAFELWSASAFHFHRANEAVLRRYFDHSCGPGKRPSICTMGTMLRKLETDNCGDEQVIVALKNITKFHRNPNSHPGDFIDNAEQAFSLVAAVRASMGYMLDIIPVVPFDELTEIPPNHETNAPPLIVPQATG